MENKCKKAKGNRFENYLIGIFREQLDATAHRTTGSGSGLDKNDLVLPNYNIEVEAKNGKRYGIGASWEQLKRQRTNRMNVLAIRNPKKPEFEETLIVMELGDFIELVLGDNKPSAVDLPADLKYKVKRMKDATHEVFKYLNN